MPSQTGIELYTFQSVTLASSLFHQDTEMYNDQQIVATSRSSVLQIRAIFTSSNDLTATSRRRCVTCNDTIRSWMMTIL